MPVVNAFGTWRYLGEIAKVTQEWQFFTEFPQSKNSVLWLQQFGDLNWIPQYQVRGYIRAAYFDGTRYLFDRDWRRIWPKDEPEILQYPYPPDLITEPLPQRQFQIKYTVPWRKTQLQRDFTWTVELFEKTDTLATYPGDLYPAVLEEQQQ